MAVSMTPAMQAEIRILPGNDKCVDCGQTHPQWASITFGSLMCLECSGAHRGMGVHISFVRSVTMDSWSDKQLQMMTKSSNDEVIAFWKKHNVDPRMSHNAKYHEPASQLYADRLKAKVEGRPLPTKLPARQAAPASAYDGKSGGMSAGGFGGGDAKGSEALSGESTDQYAARQKRIQAEARARMRSKFGGNGSSMGGVGSNSDYNPATGQYGSGGGGLSALGQGDLSLNNVQDALGQGVGKLRGWGSQLVEDESVQGGLQKTTETVSAGWGGLKRWGSVLSDKVKDLTVADPEPGALTAGLGRGGLARGSSYEGFGGGGSSTSLASQGGSSQFEGFGSSMPTIEGSRSISDSDAMPRTASHQSFSSNGSGGSRGRASPVPPVPSMSARASSSPVPPPAPGPRQTGSEPGAEAALAKLCRLPQNIKCADCQVVAPGGHGAVVMKYGIFVCHTCKSAHQSYSHLCKSVSQSFWTHKEVDQLRRGGNKQARASYLASMDPSNAINPDSNLVSRKTFVSLAYNENLWYREGVVVAPDAPAAPRSTSKVTKLAVDKDDFFDSFGM